ncbi:MAG: Glu/Leu/Phe/Val dehydrogenase [Pseudomonadales bacterium]
MSLQSLDVVGKADFDEHEKVVRVTDQASGLRAIIALHNTNLGPGLGGCRMYPYASEEQACTDALRLSRGMTYKAAMADLPLGGGKSVIIGDPKRDKTDALFEAMATAVNELGGRYIIAQDSGTTVADMQLMAEHTEHIAGGRMPSHAGNAGGSLDPSPATALGVFKGLEAAAKFRFGGRTISGLSVSIQGLGNVGFDLAKYLHEAGVELFVQDINAKNVRRAVDELGATELVGDQIYRHKVDVFAPCALGGVINDSSIVQLNCQLIAGAANNQLVRADHGRQLAASDILYVPDYVLNAGGIIAIHHARVGSSKDESNDHVANIGDTVMELLQRSKYSAVRPERIADRMAEERFKPNSSDVDEVA